MVIYRWLMRSIAQDLEEGEVDRGGGDLHDEAHRGLHRRRASDSSGDDSEELSFGEAEMVCSPVRIRSPCSNVLQLATR